MPNVHVIPLGDVVSHTKTDECICGPAIEFVPGDDESGFLHTHASLDGRELGPADHAWACYEEVG